MLDRMANREDPDQTASEQFDLDLPCLSRPFKKAASVLNFRTFTVLDSRYSPLNPLPYMLYGKSCISSYTRIVRTP